MGHIWLVACDSSDETCEVVRTQLLTCCISLWRLALFFHLPLVYQTSAMSRPCLRATVKFFKGCFHSKTCVRQVGSHIITKHNFKHFSALQLEMLSTRSKSADLIFAHASRFRRKSSDRVLKAALACLLDRLHCAQLLLLV